MQYHNHKLNHINKHNAHPHYQARLNTMPDLLSIFTSPDGVKNAPFEIKTALVDMSLQDTKALALRLVDSLVHLKDETGEFRVPLATGGFKVDSKSWNNWEWTQGVGLYGMWVLFEITGDATVLGHIQAWFDHQFAKGTPTKNVNSMAPMLTLAYLYEHTGEIKYRAYLESWAEFIMHGIPRTTGLFVIVHCLFVGLFVHSLFSTDIPFRGGHPAHHFPTGQRRRAVG